MKSSSVINLSADNYLFLGALAFHAMIAETVSGRVFCVCATGDIPLQRIKQAVGELHDAGAAIIIVFSELYTQCFFYDHRGVTVYHPDVSIETLVSTVMNNRKQEYIAPLYFSGSELKIMRLLSQRTQQQVAKLAGLNFRTISHYKRSIMRKMGFSSDISLYRFLRINAAIDKRAGLKISL